MLIIASMSVITLMIVILFREHVHDCCNDDDCYQVTTARAHSLEQKDPDTGGRRRVILLLMVG